MDREEHLEHEFRDHAEQWTKGKPDAWNMVSAQENMVFPAFLQLFFSFCSLPSILSAHFALTFLRQGKKRPRKEEGSNCLLILRT